MASFAVIDASGTIVNTIELDDGAKWEPPDDHTMAPAGAMCIGGTFVGGIYTAPAPNAASVPVAPPSILSQDLMAQFTADDAAKIKAAVDSNVQFWLLWSAMQAQSSPMEVANERFKAGWAALVSVLGAPRMAAIATALGVTI